MKPDTAVDLARITQRVNAPRLGTVNDASGRLSVSRAAMYRDITAGLFPPGVIVRLGKRIRVNMTELEQFIAAGGTAAAASAAGEVTEASGS